MTNDFLAVVYVLNAEIRFQKMAILSALTLRLWNKESEIIFLVCGSWDFPTLPELLPYQVIHKPPRIGLFPLDKVLLTELDQYASLLYLDADTIILSDIQKLSSFTCKDLAARLAWVYQQKEIWNSRYDAAWRKAIETARQAYNPIFNSGVLLFQNHSHVKIKDAWTKYMKQFLRRELPPVYGSFRHFEQLGLALAVSDQNLSVEFMTESQHGFGWVPESPRCMIYHLASKRYAEKLGALLNETGLASRLTQMSSYTLALP